jgi:hypothetical protein
MFVKLHPAIVILQLSAEPPRTISSSCKPYEVCINAFTAKQFVLSHTNCMGSFLIKHYAKQLISMHKTKMTVSTIQVSCLVLLFFETAEFAFIAFSTIH